MRINDWGSDVCSSDLLVMELQIAGYGLEHRAAEGTAGPLGRLLAALRSVEFDLCPELDGRLTVRLRFPADGLRPGVRSEEHTSELQSLMRTSYAVFCLKKKKHTDTTTHTDKHS